MKTLIIAAAFAALIATGAQAGEARLIKASGQTVVTDTAKGDEKWVRVDPDVLLVRVGTGNVLMRIENVFY